MHGEPQRTGVIQFSCSAGRRTEVSRISPNIVRASRRRWFFRADRLASRGAPDTTHSFSSGIILSLARATVRAHPRPEGAKPRCARGVAALKHIPQDAAISPDDDISDPPAP
eukprot:9445298-Pyramimonas_sp.AAC.1